MAIYKMSAAVVSAAVLAACTQSAYFADLDADRREGRIVCRNEAPFGSKIRRKTCRLVGGITEEDRREMFGAGYHEKPFVTQHGGVSHGAPASNSAPASKAPEGSCGGAM
jgi:hypothetical protein